MDLSKLKIFIEHATPHTMRHSKAMHLTESDINPVYIRDFFGHTDLKVTQIYAKTSVEMKRKALQKLKGQEVVPASSNPVNDWSKDGNLLEWLNSLGH
ncbi:MAG: tyrosine-type recombinase/integrase [Clostridioides difficile]|nr:tyrosine-type recombinase/integrase [Clostridioides difficile]